MDMNAKFFDLKKEKQDRMINAALKIFALRGYRHASTDVVPLFWKQIRRLYLCIRLQRKIHESGVEYMP